MTAMSEAPARITTEDVAHVAQLARLRLTAEELELFTPQLAAVLDHARDVEALDLAGVEPMSHPLPLSNVLREDVAESCLDRAEVLGQAPEVESDRFRVPRILGEAP
jgi:aspartyl-tRNA(Asn)/glutamyl-tRNA(Gln) amidotransferase subunit C